MTEKDFVPPAYSGKQEYGSTAWQAPSNIALVKYWGKRGQQVPANPSLSFTLDASATITRLSYRRQPSGTGNFSFEVLLDGLPSQGFKPKIEAFLERAAPYLPFLREYHFTIETHNTFPHSSGIASSASGMAALALCLVDMERPWLPQQEADTFVRKASFLARLGSGSACRSIEGPLVQWGEKPGIPGSSDLYAVPYPFQVHSIFHDFQDTILLVEHGQKSVSSTVGHSLMHGHAYAASRFEQAQVNLDRLKPIFAAGDLDGFIAIVEQEALSLHAMMMTSMPYFILMKPNTLEIIRRIWALRREAKVPLCFTLDAGANVHLLYPQEIKQQVTAFIKEELAQFCENRQYICDQIGYGAKKM